MIYLKQSTASQVISLGFFVDATDGNTEETGLTISNTDILIWKNGADVLASKNSGGATHISNGIYYATLDATDTDTLGSLMVFVHESGARPVVVDCCVLTPDAYDELMSHDKTRKYFQLAMRNDEAITTDNAAELTEINADGGSGSGSYANQTKSLMALTNGANIFLPTADDSLDAKLASFSDLITTIQTKIRKYFQLALRIDDGIATDNATELDELNANEGSGGAGSYANATASQMGIFFKVRRYLQLALRKDAAIANDNAAELAELNANEETGAGSYDNTTDSQQAQTDAVSALNNFDPAVDVVAHVTLVDTTTANTDMVSEPDSKADIAAEVLTQAAAAPISANIKRVNDVAIQGTGVAGSDEWRKE